MSRVHLLPAGTMGIPMPALVKGQVDRKLPGGYPPANPRNVYRSLVGQHVRKAPKYVELASSKWFEMEREFKRGQRAYDSTIQAK
jgi:hypothetical protein